MHEIEVTEWDDDELEWILNLVKESGVENGDLTSNRQVLSPRQGAAQIR